MGDIPKDRIPEVQEAVKKMMLKAQELGFSLSTKAAEAMAAMESPKFVYVSLDRTWLPWKDKDGKKGNDGGFVITWGAEKVGFGELTFCRKDGKILVETEGMGKEFTQMALLALLENAEIVE